MLSSNKRLSKAYRNAKILDFDNDSKPTNTIVSLKLDFAAQKKGGTAVSAVWTLVYLLAPCPAEPRSTPTHTGGTHCAPLLKSKSMLLLV